MMRETPVELGDIPLDGVLWLASFAIAALASVLAVLRQRAGLVMVIAGAIPFGVGARRTMSARDQVLDLGLPLPQGGNPAEALDMMREFIAIGLPVYIVSAALLVVIGLVRLVRGT